MSETPGGLPPTRPDERAGTGTGTRADGGPPAGPPGPAAASGATAADPEPLSPGAATRPDGDAEPYVPDRTLPAQLAHYTIEAQLGHGGQAVVYRCGGPAGAQVAIKIYDRPRPGIERVWDRWRHTDPRYVVPLAEPPLVVSGRCYEVTPYQPLGALDEYARRCPEGLLSEQELEAVVEQIAAALHHVHTELGSDRLVHRDVKPPNILVADDRPLRVRLTDFGISVVQQETFEQRDTRSRTLEYAAPEALMEQPESTPHQDWWSLGMTVAELCVGRHPFDGLSQEVIARNIALNTIHPIDTHRGPRWQTLVRGLLVRDPEQRWGYAAIQDWLAGHPWSLPEEEPAAADQDAPFEFPDGRWVHSPAELAAAIAAHWTDAVQTLVLTDRRRAELRDWVRRHDPELGRAVEEVIERQLWDRRPPDQGAIDLLVALDRRAAPVFRGRPVGRAELAPLAAAAAATGPDGAPTASAAAAAQDVRLLFETDALARLADLDGCAELRTVDARWRQLATFAEAAVDLLRVELPETAPLPDPEQLRLLLLGAAADAATATALATAAGRVNTRRNRRLDWFRRLTEYAHGPDASAAHAVIMLVEPLAADPLYRGAPRERDRVRRFLGAGGGRPGGLPPARQAVRWTRRQAPVLAGALGYTALVATAAAGVGAATTVVQGALSGLVLLAAGVALLGGMLRPWHRWADALVTGWAGAVVGLGPAALLGAVVGLAVGPVAGWPAFWGAWVVTIVTGTALGALR